MGYTDTLSSLTFERAVFSFQLFQLHGKGAIAATVSRYILLVFFEIKLLQVHLQVHLKVILSDLFFCFFFDNFDLIAI